MSTAESPVQNVVATSERPTEDLAHQIAPGGIWTTLELAILKEHMKYYRTETRKQKTEYVRSTVCPLIKKSWSHGYRKKYLDADPELKKEWKAKKDRIFTWFHNHAATERKTKIPGLNDKVTFQSVFKYEKRKEIEEEAQTLSGGVAKGSRYWLKYYQKARMAVQSRLTEDETAEYHAKVVEWERNGVPPEVQARTAARHAARLLKKMDKIRWETMRMRSMLFEGHNDEEGRIKYSITDTASSGLEKSNIPTFHQVFPEFSEQSRKYWVDYLMMCADIEKGVITAEPPGTRSRIDFDEAQLILSKNGFPRVPEPVKNDKGMETNKVQQDIIRAYINKIYSLAKGRSIPVPYQAIGQNPNRFFDPEYFPRNVEFQYPGKYISEDSNTILRFWRTRQDKGLIPFKFRLVEGKNGSEIANYPPNIFEEIVDATEVRPASTGIPVTQVNDKVPRPRTHKRRARGRSGTAYSDEDSASTTTSPEDDEPENEDDSEHDQQSEAQESQHTKTPPDISLQQTQGAKARRQKPTGAHKSNMQGRPENKAEPRREKDMDNTENECRNTSEDDHNISRRVDFRQLHTQRPHTSGKKPKKSGRATRSMRTGNQEAHKEGSTNANESANPVSGRSSSRIQSRHFGDNCNVTKESERLPRQKEKTRRIIESSEEECPQNEENDAFSNPNSPLDRRFQQDIDQWNEEYAFEPYGNDTYGSSPTVVTRSSPVKGGSRIPILRPLSYVSEMLPPRTSAGQSSGADSNRAKRNLTADDLAAKEADKLMVVGKRVSKKRVLT